MRIHESAASDHYYGSHQADGEVLRPVIGLALAVALLAGLLVLATLAVPAAGAAGGCGGG